MWCASRRPTSKHSGGADAAPCAVHVVFAISSAQHPREPVLRSMHFARVYCRAPSRARSRGLQTSRSAPTRCFTLASTSGTNNGVGAERLVEASISLGSGTTNYTRGEVHRPQHGLARGMLGRRQSANTTARRKARASATSECFDVVGGRTPHPATCTGRMPGSPAVR